MAHMQLGLNESLLPMPEPSPEAGSYVGQHSQGLGGHYAAYGCSFSAAQALGSDVLSSSAPGTARRRKSTEI